MSLMAYFKRQMWLDDEVFLTTSVHPHRTKSHCVSLAILSTLMDLQASPVCKTLELKSRVSARAGCRRLLPVGAPLTSAR
jgi:hypothetical protein